MAKLIIFAALFAALIAIASATTTYTTVVTTTVAEGENPTSSCQEEMQGKRMNHCRMWMMHGRQGEMSSFLRTAVANPRYQEEHLEECCDQLKSISSECQCDAIRKMMMDMQQQKGMEEMMEKMRKKAESLPMMCGIQTECRMRAIYF